MVGGAVRDIYMGEIPKDRDYVVLGSSPEEMLSLGFEQVGADFPVFLHPETKEEYALARRERKVGTGYLGFECDYKNLNPELLQKFIELGYSLDIEYDIVDLVRTLKHINQ